MPIYCVSENTFYQEAPARLRAFYRGPETAVLYAVKDIETIRPFACHKCGARYYVVNSRQEPMNATVKIPRRRSITILNEEISIPFE